MFRNPWVKSCVVPLMALTATLAWAAPKDNEREDEKDHVKHFKITGEGVAPLGLPLPGQPARHHTSEGHASHLGEYTGDGTVQTDSAVFNPATGTFTGEFGSGSPYVFTGENGAKLVCEYGRTAFGAKKPGTFELTIVGQTADGHLIVTAHFIAEFVPQSELCTGKFEGVTGSWIMYAWTEPFVLGSSDPINYSWKGEGSLTFE